MVSCGVRSAAKALIRPLAWELPYAESAALEKKKKKKSPNSSARSLRRGGLQWQNPNSAPPRGSAGRRDGAQKELKGGNSCHGSAVSEPNYHP